jgi:hypothetical protein
MIQFNDKKLEAEIATRAGEGSILSPSLTAKRDMERYYHLLHESMPALTVGEANAIADACNGWAAWDTPHTPDYLWVELDDAIRLDGHDAKWGIGADFGQRLRALTAIQRYALVDAAERFWQSQSREIGDFFKLAH